MTEEEILIEKQKREIRDREERRKKFKEQFLHNWRGIEDNLKKLTVEGEVNVFLVTQRPNMARTIANVLAKENKITEFDGIHDQCPLYCFESKFKSFIANIKVTSVMNNLYDIDFENPIEEIEDPKELFVEKTLKVPRNKLV